MGSRMSLVPRECCGEDKQRQRKRKQAKRKVAVGKARSSANEHLCGIGMTCSDLTFNLSDIKRGDNALKMGRV